MRLLRASRSFLGAYLANSRKAGMWSAMVVCFRSPVMTSTSLCDQPEAIFTAITRSKILDSALHEAMELAVQAVNA